MAARLCGCRLISARSYNFFGQRSGLPDALGAEEQRFAGLLTRGRKVLAQFNPGRPLTEDDLRYLHQTHGLPPELVTELLA